MLAEGAMESQPRHGGVAAFIWDECRPTSKRPAYGARPLQRRAFVHEMGDNMAVFSGQASRSAFNEKPGNQPAEIANASDSERTAQGMRLLRRGSSIRPRDATLEE
jgi:hypothetical protein